MRKSFCIFLIGFLFIFTFSFKVSGVTFSEINPGQITGVRSGSNAIGDIDNDGDLDIIITGLDGPATTHYAKIYQNDGTGSFTEINPGQLQPVDQSSIVLGDIDNDNDLDLILIGCITTASPNGYAKIYQNDGTGSFTEINPGQLQPCRTGSLSLGDLDNDGDLDLILFGLYFPSSRYGKIYQNDGTGSFTEINAGDLPGLEGASSVLGDIDNDGDLDLIICGNMAGPVYITRIYQNDGTGHFTEINAGQIITMSRATLKFGDIDNDGDLDLILIGYYYDGSYVLHAKTYQNDGAGNFTEVNPGMLTPGYNESCALGDLDNDGDLDLILSGWTGTEIFSEIYENDGTGYFTEINPGTLIKVHDSMSVFGDIDDDGDLDLIQAGMKIDGITITTVYKNNGSRSFTEINSGQITGVRSGENAIGDIDNDGDLDIIITGLDGPATTHYAKIYQNNGAGSFTEINPGQLQPVDQSSIVLGDIDNDNDLDLILIGCITTASPNGYAKIYQNDGTGSFTEINPGQLQPCRTGSLSLGDIDGDNDLDLILFGLYFPSSRYGKIYQNDGTGSFTEINAGDLPGLEGASSVLGDIDNDNDLDLIICGNMSGPVYITRIYQNDGTGHFTEINAGQIITMSRATLNLGDIDNDNDLDLILIGYYYDGSYVLHAKTYQNDGAGNFTEVNPGMLTPGYNESCALGDLDNDGDLDLISSGWTGTEIFSEIYENDGTGYFTEINPGTLIKVHDSMSVLGDIDNDGFIDLVQSGMKIDGVTITTIYKNIEFPLNSSPPTPTNFQSVDNGGFWRLSWDAPVDDHTSSDMMQYKVAISTCVSGLFGYTSKAIDLPAGQANVGNVCVAKDHYIQTKIPTSKSLYWTVAAIDTSFKNSPFSSQEFVAATSDLEIPGQIIDLSSLGTSYNYITLEWTAPGDDGYSCWPGQIYDIRYSDVLINDGNWGSCTQVGDEPTPLSGGSNQVFTVTGLTSNSTYYFGIKTRDEFSQWSDLSNIVSGYTGVIYGNRTQTISYTANDGYHISDWVINVRLFNSGGATATTVAVEIVNITDWVIIDDANAVYPDINAGQEVWSAEGQPFMFDLTNRPPATNYIMIWLKITYAMSGKGISSEIISMKVEIPGKDSSVPKNLTALSRGSFIKLRWQEVSGVDGYNVYRLSGDFWKKINQKLVTDNSFKDENVTDDIEYSYKVTSVTGTSESGFSAVAKVVFEKEYETLDEIITYPNPAKDKVTFGKLPKGSKITIYTLTGELVYTLEVKGSKSDWYLINKAGKKVSNGIYYYVIKHKNGNKTGKLAIVR